MAILSSANQVKVYVPATGATNVPCQRASKSSPVYAAGPFCMLPPKLKNTSL